MPEQTYFAGYCLRNDQEVAITVPKDVMGALFRCLLCGQITEKYSELQHLIEPSKPLLERLRSTQKVKENVRLDTS